jgi:hypothetical protein
VLPAAGRCVSPSVAALHQRRNEGGDWVDLWRRSPSLGPLALFLGSLAVARTAAGTSSTMAGGPAQIPAWLPSLQLLRGHQEEGCRGGAPGRRPCQRREASPAASLQNRARQQEVRVAAGSWNPRSGGGALARSIQKKIRKIFFYGLMTWQWLRGKIAGRVQG